jgi:hypothetical protein
VCGLPFTAAVAYIHYVPRLIPELVSLDGFRVVLTCISVGFAMYVRLLIRMHATVALSVNTVR